MIGIEKCAKKTDWTVDTGQVGYMDSSHWHPILTLPSVSLSINLDLSGQSMVFQSVQF